MQSKTIRSIDIPIIVGFILLLGIAYNIMSENQAMVSSIFTITFIYVFILFIKGVFDRTISRDFSLMVYVSIILVLVNVTLSGTGNFDYYKKSIMYISTLMWMTYCVNYKVSKLTVFVILFLVTLINISYENFFETGFIFEDGETLLNLNFSNPNEAGMFIVTSLLYLGVFIVAGWHLGIKIKYFIILLVGFVSLFSAVFALLLLTGCRSAILSLALFVILVIADVLFKKGLPIRKRTCVFLALIPFIFVFIYLLYVNTLSVDVSFGHEGGKDAGNRIKIWKPIIDNFFHYLAFGDYYGISKGTGGSQMHNTHLDVYASYGIVPLIIYIKLLSKVIWQSWRNAKNRFKRISVFAFISCQVYCTFEAGFVSGSAGLYILIIGFLLLANYQSNEDIISKQCLRQIKYRNNC